MSAEYSDLNSDDNHNFYNDIDNSNDDDDDGNINDSYNNDEYRYPSELGQIIRISAFVCLLQEEFRISLISSWLYCLILETKSHMSSELVMRVSAAIPRGRPPGNPRATQGQPTGLAGDL